MKSFRWTEAEVVRALGLSSPEVEDRVYPRVSTDTRKLGQGDLFVALRGDRFDAHNFLAEAAAAGAAGAVVSRIPDKAPQGLRYFRVDDTLHALGALGRYRRERLAARVVGVVGSNGKTTTKDLIRAALGTRFRVHATEGNLNNQIGVPLTLLATPDDAEVLVVEMGTNEPGEIRILSRMVQPDAVVITSIGEEHLEKLGSLEGVLEEEISVLEGIREDAVALVAEEPPALPERARARLGAERVRVAGFATTADLHPEGGPGGIRFEPDGSTRWSWQGVEIHLPIPGRFNVRNALLALGLALHWDVPAEEAARGIERVPRPKLRGEWHEIGKMRVLADCYNANPPSTIAAVELLSQLPAAGRKVVVLGTMREMGGATAAMHRQVAEVVAGPAGEGLDLVVATGEFVAGFRPFADGLGERLVSCEDPVEAFHQTAPRLEGSETVLLKASRGEALERWLDLLKSNYEC